MEDPGADLRSIPTATWSDALDELGVSGVLEGFEWRAGEGVAMGDALTVVEEVGVHGAYTLDDFSIGSVIARGGPQSVLFISMDGGARVSTLGGLAAAAAVRRDIAGVVIDGGCRDLEEIRRTGLHVASRWVTPVSGKRRLRVADFNVPISCGGVTVAPGDLIVMDQTGTVVVPLHVRNEASRVARALAGKDVEFQRALERGEPFDQVAHDLGHL